MPFLVSLLCLMYGHLFCAVRNQLAGRSRAVLSHTLVAAIGVGAALTGTNMLPELIPGINVSVWLFQAFGICSLYIFGKKALKLLWNHSSSSGRMMALRSLTTVISVIASLFMTIAVGDHFLFFGDGSESTVMTSTSMAASNIACDSRVLAKKNAQDIVYRCPTFFVWGGGNGHPFAPWPNYKEGHTLALNPSEEPSLDNDPPPASH